MFVKLKFMSRLIIEPQCTANAFKFQDQKPFVNISKLDFVLWR